MLETKPKQWERYRRSIPPEYRVLTARDAATNPAYIKRARQFIDYEVKRGAPIGTAASEILGGRWVMFIVEPHYHPPGGAAKPWGWHKGATVFVGPPYQPQITPSQIQRS